MGSIRLFNLIKGFLRGRYRATRNVLLNHSKLARSLFTNKDYAASKSDYCYNIWMKHYENWMSCNAQPPEVVLEIGSGNSLGVGITALLTGASKFYALEQTQFWNNSTNLQLFDQLLERIRHGNRGDDIPEEKIATIRKELEDPFNSTNIYLRSIIPWTPNDIPDNSIDFIISHTVLQHVMKLSMMYTTMKKWLKSGGYMSHTIDFSSMNTSKLWNGHWTYEKQEWKIITGGTPLINRAAMSKHLDFLRKHSFSIKAKNIVSKKNQLQKSDLAKGFEDLLETDLTTAGLYYFAENN